MSVRLRVGRRPQSRFVPCCRPVMSALPTVPSVCDVDTVRSGRRSTAKEKRPRSVLALLDIYENRCLPLLFLTVRARSPQSLVPISLVRLFVFFLKLFTLLPRLVSLALDLAFFPVPFSTLLVTATAFFCASARVMNERSLIIIIIAHLLAHSLIHSVVRLTRVAVL